MSHALQAPYLTQVRPVALSVGPVSMYTTLAIALFALQALFPLRMVRLVAPRVLLVSIG